MNEVRWRSQTAVRVAYRQYQEARAEMARVAADREMAPVVRVTHMLGAMEQVRESLATIDTVRWVLEGKDGPSVVLVDPSRSSGLRSRFGTVASSELFSVARSGR